MTKRLLLSILMTGFVGLCNIDSQSSASDFLNEGALEQAVVSPIGSLNSGMLEFSPYKTDEGLFYIQSDLDKKRIKREAEIDFRLRFAPNDSLGGFKRSADIAELRMKGFIEGPVTLSEDQQWMYMTRNLILNRPGKEDELKLGIFVYQKEDGKWTYKGELPVNSYDYNVCHPTWDESSNRLIFASDMPGGYGKLDLYEIRKDNFGKWSVPANLGPTVNGNGNDCFPFIYRKHFLFYSSDLSESNGGFDFRYSVWEKGSWIENQLIPGPINSKSDDIGLMVDKGGNNIYFSSARAGGKGKDDLYMIALEENFIIREPDQFSMEVVHSVSHKPISEAVVNFIPFKTQESAIIKNESDQLSVLYNIDLDAVKNRKTYISDAKGQVNFDLEAGKYIMQVEKENFYVRQELFSPQKEDVHQVVSLDSMICKSFKIEVVDFKTKEKINNALISTESFEIPMEFDPDQKSLCILKDQIINVFVNAEGYKEQQLGITFKSVQHDVPLVINLKKADEYVEGLPMMEGEIFVLEDILYALDAYKLNEKARNELDLLAQHLKNNSNLTIELSSHTDSRGRESYNQILSDKRANTARSYLIDQGVEAWRIIAVGYGESRLLNDCDDLKTCSESKHAVNRRTEVKIVSRL